MELDSKQKVLLAIYSQYQKDVPDMNSITHTVLDLPYDVFKIAVAKLMNEGLINDAVLTYGGSDPHPLVVNLGPVKMTPDGIEYVESKLGIDKTLAGTEKVDSVIQTSVKWGWEQLKDFAAKVLAEMMK